MNPIAKELNTILEGTVIQDLLSDYGKRFYFPKGIVSQSGEAKKKATRFNATIGMATAGGVPMSLPCVRKQLPGLSEVEIFPYAPTPGVPALRDLWRKEMDIKNPALKGKLTSLPLVTTGLTHGISVLADMFLDKGDNVVVPDMYWGNYNLIFEGGVEAKIISFPFFNALGEINIQALKTTINDLPGVKVVLVLNFPNNPTGYSPSKKEADELITMLGDFAREGKKILAVCDDAYFGLFYEKETRKESLFSNLADVHENLLAVKIDGATKENFVWGFRVGFLTFASRGLTQAHLEALNKKTAGSIRASISNSSKLSQSILQKSLSAEYYKNEKDEAFQVLKLRYLKVKELVDGFAQDSPLKALPFNSGYFMTFVYEGNAETLRLHLLDKYGVGTISIKEKYLRIAFSSVELEQLEELYTLLDKAAREIL